MSLFGGLFATSGNGGLFAKSSQFKQQQQEQQQQQQQQQDNTAAVKQPSSNKPAKQDKHVVKASKEGKKRKHASADAEPVQEALGAGVAAVATSHKAVKQPKEHKQKHRKQADKHSEQAHKASKQQQRSDPQQQNSKRSTASKQQPAAAAATDGGAQAAKAAKAAEAAAAAAASAAAAADASVQHMAKKAKHSHKQKQQQAPASGTDSDSDSPAQQAAADTASDSDTEATPAAVAAAAAAAPEPVDPEAAAKAAAEKLSRTIFVGNLPVSIKRKHLKQLFSEFGPVESVRLRSVPLDMEAKKKLPRKAAVIRGMVTAERGGVKAYVVFEREESVQPALSKNMTVVEGNHIRVDRAAQPAAAAAKGKGAAGEAGSGKAGHYEPSRSIFVGGLDFHVSEEELIGAFANMDVPHVELREGQDTHIDAVRIVRDPNTNMGIGVGYVMFKTKAAARAALELNGITLNKRKLRISRINKQPSAGGMGSGGARGPRDSSSRDGKRFGQGPGGRSGPGGAAQRLGVRQGGVQKRPGFGRSGAAAAAAGDWQGLQTKGKGAKLRGPKVMGASSGRGGGGAGGGRPMGGKPHKAGGKGGGKAGVKGPKGKRPAVAARKAAQRAKAASAKKK